MVAPGRESGGRRCGRDRTGRCPRPQHDRERAAAGSVARRRGRQGSMAGKSKKSKKAKKAKQADKHKAGTSSAGTSNEGRDRTRRTDRRGGRRRIGRWLQAQDEAPRVRGRHGGVAGRTRGDAGMGEGHRRQDLRGVRGARFGRQGWHDQADHRADEPSSVQAHRAAGTDRTRALADVHPTLHRPLSRGGGGRHLRSQLVQPRRCRAGAGILHDRGDRAFPDDRPAGRTGDGRLGNHPDQVLAQRERRRAGRGDSRAGSTTRARSGSCRPPT